MARPGRVAAMPDNIGHPAGMTPALAAAALTLCDLDTPVWLGPGLDTATVRGWLRFHTGAPLAASAAAADFALLDDAAGQPTSADRRGGRECVLPCCTWVSPQH